MTHHDTLSFPFLSRRKMLLTSLVILLSFSISVTSGVSCACCFPRQPDECQTTAISLPSCEECSSSFCANHVKGCQGAPPCISKCIGNSSTTNTPVPSSSPSAPVSTTTLKPGTSSPSLTTITTTTSRASGVQMERIIIIGSVLCQIFLHRMSRRLDFCSK